MPVVWLVVWVFVAEGQQMTAYGRPVGATLKAKITAVVMAEPNLIAKEVAARCGCSRSAVYSVREMLGLRTRKKRWTWRHRVTTKYDSNEKHCPRCGLRGEHECLPESATAYMGRREEPHFGSAGL